MSSDLWRFIFENATEDHPSGCISWTYRRGTNFYGHAAFLGKKYMAHRLSWMLANGALIPEGLYVLHSCDNPGCVNPAHLSLGTAADNIADMVAKGRAGWQSTTHCKRGHERSEDNTLVDHAGANRCRPCRRQTERAIRGRRRERNAA